MLFGSQVYRQRPSRVQAQLEAQHSLIHIARNLLTLWRHCQRVGGHHLVARSLGYCPDSVSFSGFTFAAFPACSAYSPVLLTLPASCPRLCPSPTHSQTHMSLITLTTVNASRQLLSHTLAHPHPHPRTPWHTITESEAIKRAFNCQTSSGVAAVWRMIVGWG